MRIAYLYVRVNTDEQKRKGYSLPKQEERLLLYCRYNNIEVKGIYHEDFSAKNFNCPEWKNLYFEINRNYGPAVCDLLREKGFDGVLLYQDMQGADRMAHAKKP